MINCLNLDEKNYKLGGKANSLIKLTLMGLPIPKFFVIPNTYFLNFVKYNNIEKEIENLKADKKFSKIKELVLSCDFSEDVKKEIEEMLQALNLTEMSVRSSADNEDGENKSFAGQYETYLNVTKENLLNAIKNCWVSICDDNVISYIGEDELNIFSVNVVVQEMINPTYAGVAFSLDPTGRSKNYSVIESCEGVGEKLVSGETTPTKYLVRREIKKADLIIGERMLADKQIEELETYVLRIEKEYGFAVDTEWCFLNDKCYILQARPITAFNVAVDEIKNLITREKKLFELEIYNEGEFNGVKNLTNGLYYFKPIFEYIDENLTKIYYNNVALEEFPKNIFRELNNNYDKLKTSYEEVKLSCKYVQNVMEEKEEFNLDKFVSSLFKIQPFSSLGNLAGQGWEVDEKVKDILFDYRSNHDTIIYKGTEFLSKKVLELLPDNLKPYISVLKLEEIKNLNLVNVEELIKRKNGFIYYGGELNFIPFDKFLGEEKLVVEKIKNTGEITGNIAYSGEVKGTVKIVLSTSEFDKFEDGDILVTSMTTPKFTTLMKKASGIITDEGGVTCHASIVARELKVPCLVGCKNATKILCDGDTVILNANQGVVEIVK